MLYLHNNRRTVRSRLVSVVSLLLLVAIIVVQLSFSQFVYVISQNITRTSIGSSSNYYNNFTISTRGHFDRATAESIPEYNSTDYLYNNNISQNTNDSLQNEIMCPSEKEIVIYIHGAWTDEISANEQVNRTAMSLQLNNNTIPLIGFSWDSNTPFSEEGWKNAKNYCSE